MAAIPATRVRLFGDVFAWTRPVVERLLGKFHETSGKS